MYLEMYRKFQVVYDSKSAEMGVEILSLLFMRQ